MNQDELLVNVTEISEYLFCPRKLYIKKTRNLKEPFNEKMLVGWLRHKILDIFNKNEEAFVSSIKFALSESEILKHYENVLRRITLSVLDQNESRLKAFNLEKRDIIDTVMRGNVNELEMRAAAVSSTLEKGFLGASLWSNLSPKYLTEYKIVSKEIGLAGRIDRIIFSSDIVPCEIKNKDRFFDSDIIQLAAYSILLEKEFGKKVDRAIIETKNGKHDIEIDSEMKQKVLDSIEKIKNIEQSIPPILDSFSKCKSCAFKEICLKI